MSICVRRLPEIGDDDPKQNSFIRSDGFPEFSNVSIDRCIRRVGGQATALEDEVKIKEEYLKQSQESGRKLSLSDFFDNVLHPIEHVDKELVASWGLAKTVFHANNLVFPTKTFVSLHQRARAANLSKYNSRPIYEAIRTLRADNENSDELTTEQKRLLDIYLLEGRLLGLDLTKEYDQGELEFRVKKLSEEMITYESKTYVAVDHFSHTINDYSLVQSFPPEFLQSIAVDKKNPLNGPWKITLKPYILQNFLTYCPNREHRWNVWQADCRKCSRQTVQELDNSKHIEWTRDHRKRIRELLGYSSHAELKRDRLRLSGTEQPQNILNELRSYAKPSQQNELNRLTDFAVQSGFTSYQVEEYDVPYWNRKYNIAVNKYDENLVQEYFPIDKVFNGLFQLSEKLFGIKILERNDDTISRWHKNIKYFDVYDTRKSSLRADSSQPIGGFFLDTCISPDEELKFIEPTGHVVPIREHCNRTNSTPLISLIYNFHAPLYGKPHTLKLNQVQVVFAKFANALQKILNESNYRELSGLINIEYVNDKVCSSLFSSLLYRSDVLKSISEHISTKEPLPDEHIQAIQAQRLSLAGYNMSYQLFKSALDLELYTHEAFWLEVTQKLYAKYMVFELDKRDSRLLSMLDLVVGNWAGCYFALVWSDLMANDIYDVFDKALSTDAGTDDATAKVGQRFRDTFLSAGSNTDSLELFRNFRGRDPAIDALVTNLKLTQATANNN